MSENTVWETVLFTVTGQSLFVYLKDPHQSLLMQGLPGVHRVNNNLLLLQTFTEMYMNAFVHFKCWFKATLFISTSYCFFINTFPELGNDHKVHTAYTQHSKCHFPVLLMDNQIVQYTVQIVAHMTYILICLYVMQLSLAQCTFCLTHTHAHTH